jgi:hypothetical protein
MIINGEKVRIWKVAAMAYFNMLQGIFVFTTVSRPILGPTPSPIQLVPGAPSLGVKRPGCEADHSPPSSAELKNAWSYTSTPQYTFMAWCLVKKGTGTILYSPSSRRLGRLKKTKRIFTQDSRKPGSAGLKLGQKMVH